MVSFLRYTCNVRTNYKRTIIGVPRILEDTLPPQFDDVRKKNEEDNDWEFYQQYMRTTRINVNVRQVFPKGFDPGLGTPGLPNF